MITLVPDPSNLQPIVTDESANVGRQRMIEAIAREIDSATAKLVVTALNEYPTSHLFEVVFNYSPFLTQCMLADPGFIAEIYTNGYKPTFKMVLDSISDKNLLKKGEVTVARVLRKARRRAFLTIGLADISNAWNVVEVTKALTEFAEQSICLASETLLLDSYKNGEIEIPYPSEPAKHSGFIILAVGKLGGAELNYSSDIDLILLFDPDKVNYIGQNSLQEYFVRLGKRFVKILQEHTKDGHVFRTDLRLRPDPGSTPIVMTTQAAEAYYESMGQNWERAAMIKARPVGGDIEAGQKFINYLRPFIWRKSLDFYAIQDIHSIKRQIYAKQGSDQIKVGGHNIKLGRGGIREIEFFTQTQQLIWGGRQPDLRTPQTCKALKALTNANLVDANTTQDLIETYEFLRTVEHRLQMIDDQQTHTIPKETERIDKFSRFMGFPKANDFINAVSRRLQTVENHYAGLFEEAPPLSTVGTLAFTGEEDHPDTLNTLSSMGFLDSLSISAVIRKWHHGRYAATRSSRARELLTEIMPSLLEAFSKTHNPDLALLRFNDLLASLPAGIQILSLLHANPSLLTLLAEIMGSTPFLAETLRKHPILFDSMITADFFEFQIDKKTLAKDLDVAFEEARDFEDILSILCRQINDCQFQIGVHILSGRLKPTETGRSLSDIADTALATLYKPVEEAWAERHGRFNDNEMAILAMGKLGGQEMTLGSDLDLCFIYQDTSQPESNGRHPLMQTTYYNRLGQRFLGILTSQTRDGSLYEVDMRLRPNGEAGPLASALTTFQHYYSENAWTWEHMALTRARIVSGTSSLTAKIENTIQAVLTTPREGEKLTLDVCSMRSRIERERPEKSFWDLKNKRGGLIDIEFIAQYLLLRYAEKKPEIIATNTNDVLNNLLKFDYLSLQHAKSLIASLRFYQNLQGALRLLFGKDINEGMVTEENQDLLAVLCDMKNVNSLEEKFVDTTSDTFAIFRELIEHPAKSLSKNGNHP